MLIKDYNTTSSIDENFCAKITTFFTMSLLLITYAACNSIIMNRPFLFFDIDNRAHQYIIESSRSILDLTLILY